MGFHEIPQGFMKLHEIPWGSMRFYDVPVNRSVFTETNRGLTSYIRIVSLQYKHHIHLCVLNMLACRRVKFACAGPLTSLPLSLLVNQKPGNKIDLLSSGKYIHLKKDKQQACNTTKLLAHV
jgi:hypothetical protein